jgi:hypothetical protein
MTTQGPVAFVALVFLLAAPFWLLGLVHPFYLPGVNPIDLLPGP